MSKIQLYLDEQTVLTWEDTLSSERVVDLVNAGKYYFPLVDHEQLRKVAGCRLGDLVIIHQAENTVQDKVVVFDLCEREYRVIVLLTDGDCLQQIAFKLQVDPRTLSTCLNGLYQKFGVKTKEGLIAKVVSLGVYRPAF